MVLIVVVTVLHCTGVASLAAAPQFEIATAVAAPAAAPTSTTVTVTAPYTVRPATECLALEHVVEAEKWSPSE